MRRVGRRLPGWSTAFGKPARPAVVPPPAATLGMAGAIMLMRASAWPASAVRAWLHGQAGAGGVGRVSAVVVHGVEGVCLGLGPPAPQAGRRGRSPGPGGDFDPIQSCKCFSSASGRPRRPPGRAGRRPHFAVPSVIPKAARSAAAMSMVMEAATLASIACCVHAAPGSRSPSVDGPSPLAHERGGRPGYPGTRRRACRRAAPRSTATAAGCLRTGDRARRWRSEGGPVTTAAWRGCGELAIMVA